MKASESNAQPNAPTTSSPARGRRAVALTAAAALVCALCVVVFMFVRSYISLRDAILLERVDYVEEISSQIMNSQLFMKNEYSETVRNLAHILEREDVKTLKDVHEYLISKSRGEILLLSENNNIVDLNGNRLSMPDDTLFEKMIDNDGVSEAFTSLNYAQDSWLFAAHITPKVIEGAVYKAVILSVSADDFRSNMTISLLDDRGASYIVNNDGRIKIKPQNENLAFNGFNLFSGMLENGASPEDVERLESDLWNTDEGSYLIKVGDSEWLVGHTAIDYETSIIVAVPLTLTAAQTYRGLDSTIMLSALTIAVVSFIAMLLILRFLRRDRQREKEALAVAAKSEFFSKMSHDIRTPLNAVIGLVQLAEDGTEDETVKGYLKQSSYSAKYLLGIINDVLDVSRIESGKLEIANEPFSMSELINNVKNIVEPLASEKNLVFETDSRGATADEYVGDMVRIEQILTNLLSNAIKYTERGGRIGFVISNAPRADGRDDVTMKVTDTGVGISEQFLKRVFTPFEQEYSSYTRQNAGSGLGLSIANSLARLMGGRIDVSSKQGEGSEFTVTLPLSRAQKGARKAVYAAVSKEDFVGKRALLAEDNEVNQIVAARILSQKFGIEADVAPDGKTAVEMFAAAAPDTYDLILMDVKMPVMDGLEATRAIRALERDDARAVPIIALSANAYTEDRELSMAAGMNAHLSKPLDVEALGRVLISCLQAVDS